MQATARRRYGKIRRLDLLRMLFGKGFKRAQKSFSETEVANYSAHWQRKGVRG
jgi:hypothetical protein